LYSFIIYAYRASRPYRGLQGGTAEIQAFPPLGPFHQQSVNFLNYESPQIAFAFFRRDYFVL
jgi:hypothetical protein